MPPKRKLADKTDSASKQVKTLDHFIVKKPAAEESNAGAEPDDAESAAKENATAAVEQKETTDAITSSNVAPEQVERMKQNQERALALQKNKALQLEITSMHESWFDLLKAEFDKPYFKKIKQQHADEKEKGILVYPPEKDIYTWAASPFEDVKVVIIGQDPYHGPNQAHGLSFSVRKGVAVPPSLINIYKELEKDIENFKIPKHGFLEGWAKQGVLLLNASLTVQAAAPASHKEIGWQTFTDVVIQLLNTKGNNIVFLLWGAHAQKKGSKINQTKHLVLSSAHPSPMSANKGNWFGCRHFSKANAYLEKHGKPAINWADLP